MPRISGKDCVVYLNGIAFSGDVASFDLNTSRGTLRKPNLARKAMVRLPGLGDFELTLRIWAQADNAPWLTIQDLPNKDDLTGLVIAFGAKAGDIVFAGNGLVTSCTWRRGDDGSLGGTCVLQLANRDVGWFRSVFPIPVTANLTISGKRASATSARALLPDTTDLAIWASTGLSSVDVGRFDPGIGLFLGNTQLRHQVFPALPDPKLVNIARGFTHPLGWQTSNLADWRLLWDTISGLAPYDTQFIVAQGSAWT